MAEYTPEQILNESYDLATKSLKVIGGGGAAGLATEAKQDDGIALLTTIDADTSVLAAVDFATETTAATLATEATVATLATEATAASIDGKITACDTGAVVVSSGAITETNSGDIKTAIEKLDDLQGALKSVDTDELVTRVTDSAGTEINPAKEDGNLATVKTNTDPLVTAGAGGYIRQDSTGTIAKETGGNLAAAATVLGATADAAVETDTTGTISGKLRGLVKIFADVWDSVNNLLKVQEQSPVWSRTISPVALIGAAQDFTAAMADVGGEIPCSGYRHLRVWVTLDINDSTDCRVAVLVKHTSAGSVEAPYDPNKWALRDSTLSATGAYREWNTDADGEYLVEIELDNAMPYVQLQIQAGTVGASAGQIDAATYVLGY